MPEPIEPNWIARPETVDVVIVPGLAFDATGRRLGHGSGGLDRLLEKLTAFKIGLAFAAQMKSRVAVEPTISRWMRW